jgi:pimeloyl-[acyl-carrier protein] synthase
MPQTQNTSLPDQENCFMATASENLLDEALVSETFLRDPYPILLSLQKEDPVHWSESIGGWLIARYEDILSTFRDVSVYSNAERLSKVVEYLPSESRARFKTLEDHFRATSLIASDPPDHTRLRSLVTKVFNATRVEAMRPLIQTIITGLLDAIEPSGKMDLIRDIAVPLPFEVLGTILGVPSADRDEVKRWADRLLAFQGVNKPPAAVLEVSQKALVEVRTYLSGLIKEKRRTPCNDLLSQLVAAEAEGEKLSEQELIYTSITLLVAGHETTTSLLGNGLYTILRHPDQWRTLQKNPALLPSAIEEMLRYESPVARQPRRVVRDTILGGKRIRGGQIVFQMLNAANRDPEYFSNPQQFDICRQPNRHLAFGMGIHFCVGAMLARTEAQILFRTLLERMPQIQLVDENADWDLRKPNSRMLHSLNLEF